MYIPEKASEVYRGRGKAVGTTMLRSLLPLILASLGFFIIRFVINMPLLEWQVSEIVTDLPSTYEVDILPSPWTANLGDALDDGSYILQEIRVIGDGSFCRKENLNFVVRRSYHDEIIESVLNANQKNTVWLFAWGMIELILSGMYIWWFIIEYKHRGVVDAVIFMGIAGFIYVFHINIEGFGSSTWLLRNSRLLWHSNTQCQIVKNTL